MMARLRDSILQRLKPQEKDLVLRMRSLVKDQPLEEMLRKFSRDNKDTITEDELLIGISKVNANVHIGDIKELTRILRQSS